MRLPRWTVIAGMLAPAAVLFGWLVVGSGTGAATAPLPSFPADNPEALPRPPEEGTRGPSALQFSADGRRLYVAEQDENDIAVLEPDSGAVLEHLTSGGRQPTAIALSTDGQSIAVANRFSGTISLTDLKTRTAKQFALLGEPDGIVFGPRDCVYVSLAQMDQVAVFDAAAGRVTARIPVGHAPRSLILTRDGATLLCLNRIGGSLSFIDTGDNREVTRVALPATNLRGMALSGDGSRLVVSGQQPHNDVPTDRPEGIWSNAALWIRIAGRSASVERVQQLDTPQRGAADPGGVAIAPSGAAAYVALSGTHEVAELTWPASAAGGPALRTAVGANPRAVALRPGGELWIANHLGSTLSVIGPAGTDGAARPARTVELGAPTPSPNRRLQGRYLFSSAHIVRGRHFTCESCHPEGNTDGLSWRLAHVKEAPQLRNTRNLRGTLLLTAPYGWTSREEDFEKFIEDEVAGLLKTRLLRHPEVHALWDLANETPLPPNPYRDVDGNLTPEAVRGQALFTGSAGCTMCHMGEMRGGTERREWVGTTPAGLRLDVPHLVGAYESAPYLHDGRAATLEEIFTKYNGARRHGRADTLTAAQLADVIEYVREL